MVPSSRPLAASTLAPTDVGLVTVSTTLATNALVEDKGAEVGLFVIGHDKRLSIPVADMRFIPGGHKAKGVEDTTLKAADEQKQQIEDQGG